MALKFLLLSLGVAAFSAVSEEMETAISALAIDDACPAEMGVEDCSLNMLQTKSYKLANTQRTAETSGELSAEELGEAVDWRPAYGGYAAHMAPSSIHKTATATASTGTTQKFSNVCVKNSGGFALKFQVWGRSPALRYGPKSSMFPNPQYKCMSPSMWQGFEPGQLLAIRVYVTAGITQDFPAMIYDPSSARTAPIECTGSTTHYSCKRLPLYDGGSITSWTVVTKS